MIEPSPNQLEIAKEAINWYHNSPSLTFQISGNPGTGKSFLLHYIVDQLKIPPSLVCPMAYTGAAAIVMRSKGFTNAKTIHSSILEPVEDIRRKKDGSTLMNDYFNIPEMGVKFVPKYISRDEIKLFVIDEGMMVPKQMRSIIENYGIKCIVAGDVDQLPPVKYEPGYFMDGDIHYLTEIFRQGQSSGIIYLSQRLKRGLPIHQGYYGDCTVIYDDEVLPQMILQADILICAKNDTRQYLTDLVRKDIFKYGDGLPNHGERLVCRQNNWQLAIDGINLANGLMGEVSNYPDVTAIKKKIFKIDFKPIMLDKSFENLEVDFEYFKAHFKDKAKFKNRRFSQGEKLEYGYAITTHIAQGSEYSSGIYFQEYMNPNINNQLWYTGITRFRDNCIYVKRRRRFY